MHYYGWSRAQAADFLWRSTVVSRAGAAREIDQRIGAHLTGRLEIQRLRGAAERGAGPARQPVDPGGRRRGGLAEPALARAGQGGAQGVLGDAGRVGAEVAGRHALHPADGPGREHEPA
jgi:hypothetical protein